ncbi:MAG: 5'/3'-nucleotidase SurE [Candidatus Melainabacteria bacterium]|nr:5'/3'-nucleotidase SurE [Candidatus Melainabacteria bacterium]
MDMKPKILIINDDGIEAPGLRNLWEALEGVGDLYIVAPTTEKSGVGLSITIRDPIMIKKVDWGNNTPAWKGSGTPADCVRMSLSVLLDFKPDLIVSGINRGANSGRNIFYSGTIGGVMEGALRNVPGIAFSCVDFVNPDYKLTQPLIAPIVQHILENPLPNGTILNVNFPATKEILGLKLARQGKGFWIEDPDHRIHPEGHSYYWLGGKWWEMDEEEDSDVHLLKQGYAAAVPLHISELTDFKLFDERKEIFNASFLKEV